jgi:DNA-binding Lrp family transcriptional regulator
MAVTAYILVNAEPARTRAVFQQLREIPGAVVHEVLGPYDFVVDLETDTQEDVAAVLRERIRPIPGVNNTVTCVCF